MAGGKGAMIVTVSYKESLAVLPNVIFSILSFVNGREITELYQPPK